MLVEPALSLAYLKALLNAFSFSIPSSKCLLDLIDL